MLPILIVFLAGDVRFLLGNSLGAGTGIGP
jgi:hypothetical protein